MTRNPQTAVDVPAPPVPRHVAIIMDGNGRWAKARGKPRVFGHTRGVDAVRASLQACGERGIEYLTLFAFSSENWRRPADEVSTLMKLFVSALRREVNKLVELGVRMRVVGDVSAFDAELRRLIAESEQKTERNAKLHLTICANYGGRWDIAQAARRAAEARASGRLGQPDRGRHRAAPRAVVRARSRPADPHRRRTAHQQLPAVAACLFRAALHRRPVAGLRCRRTRPRAGVVRHAAAPLRHDGRAGRRSAGRERGLTAC